MPSVLSVERARRRNRRSTRDGLRWDRELWSAYGHGDASPSPSPDDDTDRPDAA